MAEKLWVENKHPSYKEAKRRRKYARDHYTGEVYDFSVQEAQNMTEASRGSRTQLDNTEGVRVWRMGDTFQEFGTYLKKRRQGEHVEAYRERAEITRFPNHMAALVDSYVGGVLAVEGKAERDFGDPLGDPMDPSTVLGRMWRDIDGTGLNWKGFRTRALQDLIVDDEVWYFADKFSAGTDPRIYRIEPDNVINWRENDGVLVEVLLREDQWIQENLMDEGRWAEYYVLYDLDGWRRWELVKDMETKEKRLVPVDSGEWAFPFYADVTQTRQRLPFGRSKMPLGRSVGYQMAVDHNMLYNLLSDARWNFRVINHPRLRADVDDDVFEKVTQRNAEGFNALQGPWEYISPDAQNGRMAFQTYMDEVKQFYITNHQRMSAPAIERSATEIVFDEAAGRTSFLTIMSSAIEEIENDMFFLASQLEAPTQPDTWMNTRVKYSRDFRPVDMLSQLQGQSNAFAAIATILGADTAADIVVNGWTEETVSMIRERQEDFTTEDF